jgi:hypothetical protein
MLIFLPVIKILDFLGLNSRFHLLTKAFEIPKAALLLELGWEPILDFINRQKVSYYKRLLELPDNRLCKSVFNEMVRKGENSKVIHQNLCD